MPKPDRLAGFLQLAALLGALWAGVVFVSRVSTTVAYAQSSAARVDSLDTRVDSIEAAIHATSYMSCVSFSETHPAPLVPTYCDKYTRPK